MRKAASLTAIALLVTGASACGSSSAPAPASSTAPLPTTATVPQTTTTSPPPPLPPPGQPCRGAPVPARYTHVITIVMENHGFSQVAGASPYLNRLAQRCGLATGYTAVSHPSLPNYLALVSGSTQHLDGFDCTPAASCQSGGPSIFSQTGWRVYAESMPQPCDRHNAGSYAPRHNPALYFTDPAVAGACPHNDLPLGTGGRLPAELASPSRLAPYTLIIPNLCNDEHDCPVSTGDGWLSRWVPRLLASPAYRTGTTALFITYDEDDHAEGNRVYTVVVSPSTQPGTVSSQAFTHVSLLRTQEEILGLPALPAVAGAPSMRAAFRL